MNPSFFYAVELRLSWDLFIIVFFGIVIAYSFIIGRNQTLKVIISSYMAILAADGLGNIVNRYILPNVNELGSLEANQILILMKILVFVIVIVLLSIKGGFIVNVLEERSLPMAIMATLTFGFLNAGLIVSTILVYISGSSFVDGSPDVSTVTTLYQESELVQLMINNYNIWFALPVFALVLISFVEVKKDLE